MHFLGFRVQLLSKLSYFILALILATFSPGAMASDSDANSKESSDSESEDEEQMQKGLDLETVISSKAPDQLKQHLIDYRNEHEQNYLHLIKPDQFDRFADLVADDVIVGNMLIEYAEDETPFPRFITGNKISARFIQIVTAQRSLQKDTLLMAFAMRDGDAAKALSTLKTKGVAIDQEDSYGNTAESIEDDYSRRSDYSYNMVSKNRNMARYKSQSFDNTLWQEILKDKYPLYMRGLAGSKASILDPSDFSLIALETICAQPQTGIHAAFLLRENLSSDQDRRTANDLWRAFFKAHDTLLAPKDVAQVQKLPLSGRILGVVSDRQYYPELQDATVQLITGTSRFGVKFQKATEKEAETYVWGIRGYVAQLLGTDPNSSFEDSASLLKVAFQRKSSKNLTSDQMNKLMRHQLKCTVVALYSLNELYDEYSSSEHVQKRKGDKIFDFIDDTLAGWPNETNINSKALFANVRSHLRVDSKALDF
ncbi:MAG: hypothetical protein K2W94_07940 [Alphaproteobacteria bacterium]|nr:hypothetical protein [Alphaproteobacteria bacterium]